MKTMHSVLIETPLSLSILPVEFETYVDGLVADNERLATQSRQKAALVAQTVNELRGPLTNLNLRLYLLEHAAQDSQTQHIDSLKESVANLTHMVEEILIQVRQNDTSVEDVPADVFDLHGFTGHNTLSNPF
jgi:signal transduction histidine kinase